MPERMTALVKLSAESAAPAAWAPDRGNADERRLQAPTAASDHRDRVLPVKESNLARLAVVPAAPIQAVMPRHPEWDRVTFAKPRDEAARRKLTQAIQTELRRVGCYGSDIDGTWDEDTRRAMKAFTDRINASLPVEEPDYILLTLVHGHRVRACGKECPPGQVAVAEDRCEPRAIIAQKNERAARRQHEAQIRKTKAEPERLGRKPIAAPQVPVAAVPLAPATALEVPLRSASMVPPASPPLTAPLLPVANVAGEPARAEVPVVDASKPARQIAGRAKPRATRHRNIGEFAPAFGLGRVNRPPSRAVVTRQAGSRARSSPFALLTRSAP